MTKTMIQQEQKVEITYKEFVKLKDGIDQLFQERSEVYFTELNPQIDGSEDVMRILQNRFDATNPDLI